jgi:hypothetical protein
VNEPKSKDDGSGTRTQWMRLAEEAIRDAAEWKERHNDLLTRVRTLEFQVASLLKNLEE